MKLKVMKKKIEIEIPEGKVAEWQEINGVTTLVLTDEKYNRPVTERIKTFEDACNELGDEHPLVKEYWGVININLDIKQDLISYLKLRIICAALNEGWEPQFTTNECRHYPWFYIYTQEKINKMEDENNENMRMLRGSSNSGVYCGIVYKDSISGYAQFCVDAPARLAMKSENLAVYFGQQFIDIWADYIAPVH